MHVGATLVVARVGDGNNSQMGPKARATTRVAPTKPQFLALPSGDPLGLGLKRKTQSGSKH